MPIEFATKVLKEVESEVNNLSEEDLDKIKLDMKNLREQMDRLEAMLLVQDLENQEEEEEQAEKTRDIYGRKMKKKSSVKRDLYGRVIKKAWKEKQ